MRRCLRHQTGPRRRLEIDRPTDTPQHALTHSEATVDANSNGQPLGNRWTNRKKVSRGGSMTPNLQFGCPPYWGVPPSVVPPMVRFDHQRSRRSPRHDQQPSPHTPQHQWQPRPAVAPDGCPSIGWWVSGIPPGRGDPHMEAWRHPPGGPTGGGCV